MTSTTRFGLLLLAAALYGSAQAQETDALMACQAIQDPSERLACFDAAVRGLDTQGQPAADVPSATQAPAPSVADTAPPAPPAAQASAVDTAPAGQLLEDGRSEPDPGAGDDDGFLPSWFPNVNIGFSRSNKDAAEEPDYFETELTRIQRNNLGRHFFTTREGHVWRQIQVEEIRAPDSLPATVRIEQGLIGNVRLRIVGTNRAYAVMRVE